jgi:hypothetical protein
MCESGRLALGDRSIWKQRWLVLSPAEETFADKVKKAVERRTGGTAEQKAERAKKERARYRKPVRRPRSKGE